MYSYAGFWVRLGAFLIDGLCLSPIAVLYFWSLIASRQVAAFAAIPYYLVEPAYMIIFHGVRGQSLGKMTLGLRVQFVNGQRLSWRGSLVRFSPFVVTRVCYGILLSIAILSIPDATFVTMPLMQKFILIYGSRPK